MDRALSEQLSAYGGHFQQILDTVIRIHTPRGRCCDLLSVPRIRAACEYDGFKSGIDAQITHDNTG